MAGAVALRARRKAPDIAVEIVRKPPDQVGFAVHPKRWVVELILDLVGYTADRDLADAVRDMLHACAVPPLRELAELARRPGSGFDPERSGVFERFDRTQSDAALALLRHGEVIDRGVDPSPRRPRSSTVVASIAASMRHRAGRARPS